MKGRREKKRGVVKPGASSYNTLFSRAGFISVVPGVGVLALNSQQVRLDLIAGFCARLFPTAVRLFIDEDRIEGIVVFLCQRTQRHVVLSTGEDDLIPASSFFLSSDGEIAGVEIHLPDEWRKIAT